jgi:acetamidase/formamidase
LHKGKGIKAPRVETATDYLTTGLDVDLNVAARMALEEAVDFLQTEKGMTAADAYALSSLAVDLGIGEAVDIVNLVYAKIPKNIFRSNRPYWFTPGVD